MLDVGFVLAPVVCPKLNGGVGAGGARRSGEDSQACHSLGVGTRVGQAMVDRGRVGPLGLAAPAGRVPLVDGQVDGHLIRVHGQRGLPKGELSCSGKVGVLPRREGALRCLVPRAHGICAAHVAVVAVAHLLQGFSGEQVRHPQVLADQVAHVCWPRARP